MPFATFISDKKSRPLLCLELIWKDFSGGRLNVHKGEANAIAEILGQCFVDGRDFLLRREKVHLLNSLLGSELVIVFHHGQTLGIVGDVVGDPLADVGVGNLVRRKWNDGKWHFLSCVRIYFDFSGFIECEHRLEIFALAYRLQDYFRVYLRMLFSAINCICRYVAIFKLFKNFEEHLVKNGPVLSVCVVTDS